VLAQSWAEAFAAFGTVAAFAVAARVYVRADRDRRDDEARQARLVYAEREEQGVLVVGSTGGNALSLSFLIVNGSEEPIYRPRVTNLVISDGSNAAPETRYLRFPRLVQPGERAALYVRTFHLYRGELNTPAVVDVEVLFEDARGRVWSRRNTKQPLRSRDNDDESTPRRVAHLMQRLRRRRTRVHIRRS
jgi:hypothetical protein